MKMNDTWHIPRASLSGSTAGSSSNSSSKSNSNPPTVTRLNSRHLTRHHQKRIMNDDNDTKKQQNNNNDQQKIKKLTATTPTINLGLINNDNIIATSRNNRDLIKVHRNPTESRDDNYSSSNNYDQYYEMHPSGNSDGRKLKKLMKKNIDNSIGGIKRGSRSSQGSTDSHSSSRSGSSGSLLLTAANLERFVAIHNKTNLQQSKLYQLQYGGQYQTNITSSTYSQNPLGNVDEINSERIDKNQTISNNNNDTVLDIDPNLNFIKTKDVDTMSIASSTHFTMVNGVGGPQKKIRSGICSRGHQITVLILTMSGFFLIGILLMVYLMEMRAREMPQ